MANPNKEDVAFGWDTTKARMKLLGCHTVLILILAEHEGHIALLYGEPPLLTGVDRPIDKMLLSIGLKRTSPDYYIYDMHAGDEILAIKLEVKVDIVSVDPGITWTE
jgi:hypothetical protein